MRNCVNGVVFLGLVAASGVGQTFGLIGVDGQNLRTGQSGHAITARPGDTIRVAVRPVHDAFSLGGARFDVLLDGVAPIDVGLLEEDSSFPPGDAWTVGRTPVTIGNGDAPDGVGGVISARPDPGLYGVDTVITNDEVSSDTTGWFLLYTIPPGLGGLVGAYPIESGDRLFVFEYEFVGGEDIIATATEDAVRLWRDVQDINGIVVSLEPGEGLTVVEQCPADLDGDGDADSDDFFVYLDAFANGDLSVCDLDGCGDCDADDFFAYLDLFAAGC